MLGILPADLGELLRSKISLLLKVNSKLPRVIFFLLCISIMGLWPHLCLVFLPWCVASWFKWDLVGA